MIVLSDEENEDEFESLELENYEESEGGRNGGKQGPIFGKISFDKNKKTENKMLPPEFAKPDLRSDAKNDVDLLMALVR